MDGNTIEKKIQSKNKEGIKYDDKMGERNVEERLDEVLVQVNFVVLTRLLVFISFSSNFRQNNFFDHDTHQ